MSIDKGAYCAQEQVAEKSTKSIVELLQGLGFKKKDWSFEGRKALYAKYLNDIKAADKSGKIEADYKGSANQNRALIKLFEKKIIKEGSIVDKKTGEFKKVEGLTKAARNQCRVDRAKLSGPAEDLSKVGPKVVPKVEVKVEPKPVQKTEPKVAPKVETKPIASKTVDLPAAPTPTAKPVAPTPETTTVAPAKIDSSGDEGKMPVAAPGKVEEEVKSLHQVEKKYDDEESFIRAAIDKWTADNRGSAFDTGPGEVDGTQKGRFEAKGTAVVMDNIGGKKYKVNKDPAKADVIKDYVTGEYKKLTLPPLVCIDAVQKLMQQSFGANVPKGNRSVVMFEKYARGNKSDYEVYNVNKGYKDIGELPKLPVACRPGDIITLGYPDHGHHIVVVTRVDQNGVPMEAVNSGSITSGVGKRPFFEDKDTMAIEDWDGDLRSAALVVPRDAVIKTIIRPRAPHKQYLAYVASKKRTEVASTDE